MSERAPSVRYRVRGGPEQARAAVEEFFTSRGWRPRMQADGTIAYERGSRRRTVLLGALAGKRFLLTAVTDVRESNHATTIHYRWGPCAGRALGGMLGRQRADRVHTETAAALEHQLADEGRLLQVDRRPRD